MYSRLKKKKEHNKKVTQDGQDRALDTEKKKKRFRSIDMSKISL